MKEVWEQRFSYRCEDKQTGISRIQSGKFLAEGNPALERDLDRIWFGLAPVHGV